VQLPTFCLLKALPEKEFPERQSLPDTPARPSLLDDCERIFDHHAERIFIQEFSLRTLFMPSPIL
jgi:hypothetical protein